MLFCLRRSVCLLYCILALTMSLSLHAAPLRAADAESAEEGQGDGSGGRKRDVIPRPRLPLQDFGATVEITDLMEESRLSDLTKQGKPATKVKRPIMQHMTVKRINGKIQYKIAWQTGVQTQVWQDEKSGLRVEEMPNGNIVIAHGEGSVMPELLTLTASSISWIRPQLDKRGPATLNGRECTHYTREVSIGKNLKATYQAWIDRKTGLPVALDDSVALYKIEFDAQPPTGELTIPAKFQQEIDRIIRELKSPSYL